MDKSRICISRTINLTKQKRPKKFDIVFYPDYKAPEYGKPSGCIKPQIAKAWPKHYRMCTATELKQKCYLPPCTTCPPKKKALSLWDLIKFGLKCIVASSLLYWSWESGFWGDPEETEEFYANICHQVSQGCAVCGQTHSRSKACELELDMRNQRLEEDDRCRRPLISSARAFYKLRTTWNHMVTTVFEGIAGFPFNLMKNDSVCKPKK